MTKNIITRDQEMPSSTDVLFISKVNGENWLSTSEKSFFYYSEGYRMAGESLFMKLKECESICKIFLTYPMIFCYRQFIELRLKELIFSGKRLNDQPGTFPITHSIIDLFSHYISYILPNVDPTYDKKLITHIEVLMNELNSIDKGSMSFRYPLSKTLSPLITLPNMDINNFRTVMDRLSNFFNRQLEIMQFSEEMKKEMIAELHSQLLSEY